MSRRRRHRLKLKSFYVWHRYLGVTVALFAVVLSLSGLALNHTERLRLDEHFTQSDLLLDWYGIDSPRLVQNFAVADHQVTLLGDQLYLDSTPLPGQFDQLAGAASTSNFLAIAADGDVLLSTPDGQFIERLGHKDGVPAGIAQIGTTNNGAIIVKASHGLYLPDAELLRWTRPKNTVEPVRWSQPVAASPQLIETLRSEYRSRILPLERVLLDLHSGRILGAWGPWLMDAAAVIVILLAFSGTWLWIKHRR